MFGDDFLENPKTILNQNSTFFWKIPSPKKDMKKDMFFGIFLGGGGPLLLLLLDFRVRISAKEKLHNGTIPFFLFSATSKKT